MGKKAETWMAAVGRWKREGVREEAFAYREKVAKSYKQANPGCRAHEIKTYSRAKAIKKFPPKDQPPPLPEHVEIEPGPAEDIIGLGDLPSDWQTLPTNAALTDEIQWVQSQRLLVVSGAAPVMVDLTKATQPPPSMATLGWLETSIRAYSKYCDIAARATAQQQDAQAEDRREAIDIERARALLEEMMEEKALN